MGKWSFFVALQILISSKPTDLLIQAESISVNKFNNATRPDFKLPKISRENLERNLSFRITRQYDRIVNIYRFIPESKIDMDSFSSEEEESTETESTVTFSTLTASAFAITLEKAHLDSENNIDQVPKGIRINVLLNYA